MHLERSSDSRPLVKVDGIDCVHMIHSLDTLDVLLFITGMCITACQFIGRHL